VASTNRDVDAARPNQAMSKAISGENQYEKYRDAIASVLVSLDGEFQKTKELVIEIQRGLLGENIEIFIRLHNTARVARASSGK